MRAVVLSDMNARASIAVLRSLVRRDVPVYAAVGSGKRLCLNFLRYTDLVDPESQLLRYDDSDASAVVRSLRRFRDRLGPFVLYPSGESILRSLVGLRAALADSGIILPTVDLATYRSVSDKQSFVEICRRFGLATPKEYSDLPSRFNARFVIKPKVGAWGNKRILERPALVESATGLRRLQARDLDIDSHIVQEYLDGPSFYYCALYDHGTRKQSFAQQTTVQQPGGRSVLRAVPGTLPRSVQDRVDSMMHALSWQGLMMIELKRVDDHHYAIECNPRLWGPMQLAVDNGIDFPLYLWQLATGQKIGSSSKPGHPTGYMWTAGYLQGLLLGWKTKTRFQVYPNASGKKVVFRDVWLRRDTRGYFAVELLKLLRQLPQVFTAGLC